MKALWYPDWSRGNPYQTLLLDALADQGVKISQLEASGKRFPLSQGVRSHGRPDILHIHWPYPLFTSKNRVKSIYRSCLSLLDLVKLRLSGTRIIWTVHEPLSPERRYQGMEHFFNNLLVGLCDRLIVHFPEAPAAVQKTYRSASPEKFAVIPHGHYIGWYENSVGQVEARQQLGLPPQGRTFLFFGIIRPYKGLPELFQAFSEVDHPKAHLLIAGRSLSQHSAEVEELVGYWRQRDNRLTARLEFIPDDEVQLYMNAADAVVLPFRDVFTSGSAILAMSFGKAIIAPDLPHLRYLLGDRGGILYNPADGSGLKDALETALDADLSAMGQRNLEHIRRFGWSDIGRQTWEVYSKALGESVPASSKEGGMIR